MKKEQNRVIDIKKALFSKPEGLYEKFLLIIFLTVAFMLYFMPLLFDERGPVYAVLHSLIPTMTTGWCLFSVARTLRYREKYSKVK